MKAAKPARFLFSRNAAAFEGMSYGARASGQSKGLKVFLLNLIVISHLLPM